MTTCPQCGRDAVTDGVCGFCGSDEQDKNPSTERRLIALEIKVELLERTIQGFLEQIKQ